MLFSLAQLSRSARSMEYVRNVVKMARRQSDFYADHFKHVDVVERLEDLPIIDHAKFWTAAQQNRRQVMTEEQVDGLITTSGGSTHSPKVTCYSQIELQRAGYLLGQCLVNAGVRSGDRLGNLFYAGDLYTSFLFLALAVMSLPVPAVQVPIGFTPSCSQVCAHIQQCLVTVLMGPTTFLVTIAEHCIAENITFDMIRTIIYGGEAMFDQQRSILLQTFPNARTKPLMYGSADAGFLASSAFKDTDDQLLRVFDTAAIMEIVTEDDDQRVINVDNVPGTILATNLTRQLWPVLRYPTGDRAEWVDKRSGVFRYLGRSSAAARLGPVSIYTDDLRRIVGEVVPQFGGIQAVIRQNDKARDELECVIAASPPDAEAASQSIIELLNMERPIFAEQVKKGLIAPLKVRFTRMCDMQVAVSSGKLREVIDLRFGGT